MVMFRHSFIFARSFILGKPSSKPHLRWFIIGASGTVILASSLKTIHKDSQPLNRPPKDVHTSLKVPQRTSLLPSLTGFVRASTNSARTSATSQIHLEATMDSPPSRKSAKTSNYLARKFKNSRRPQRPLERTSTHPKVITRSCIKHSYHMPRPSNLTYNQV